MIKQERESLKVKEITLRKHSPIKPFKNMGKISLEVRPGKPMHFRKVKGEETNIGFK